MRAGSLFAMFLFLMPVVVAQSNSPFLTNGFQEKMCGLGTYQDSLELAFNKATAERGETLVTVAVLPSFHREYALAFKRVGLEVMLLRTTFEKQLWTQLGGLAVSRTRQQCLDLASNAKVETVELHANADAVAQLWTAFSRINLDADTCTRRGKQCAPILDGTGYVVRTNDGRALRITEIGKIKGIKSENAALLDWIHALRRIANSSEQR